MNYLNRMRKKITIGIIALAIGFSTPSFALKSVLGAGMEQQNEQIIQDSRAALCAPATGLRDLAWNNVKALIETGGSMWQDRANSRAAYEVPKGGGVSSLYAGALWMGGISPDQQLKLAAVRFRGDGNDFWPGPLTNDGTASVTEATCLQYDRFFVSLRQDAQLHRQYFDCIAAGGDDCNATYSIPSYFYEYPAIGNTAAGQDLYLAPFYDYDQDGFYNPQNGDYPWYDFLREINCAERRREDIVPLFGDQTYYWIFNDKGNAHTESQGQPIGMEIRAQAFAFTSNDEVNNMTFYNYVLINQGSQTLTETYFGSWVDPDLGNAQDDYVGCDVQRGLGYCYNGDAFDDAAGGSLGYGSNPPAVGVDFFEGPYQDEDNFDNPLSTDIITAIDQLGIPYKGLGIGYGDGVVDNERFGMRKFVYYNNSNNPINGEPALPSHFYNYMRGFWKNGQRMKYGGNGATGAGVTSTDTDYMFPDDTDPLHWGTGGVITDDWSEESSGNAPNDRRFIQAAGPFTLKPGDYNNITLGVVWARSNSGDPFESVRLLREYDDKAQALFDNCFELVSGPDAPDVAIQELDKEVILMLTNDNPISTNYQENYGPSQGGFDPSIPEVLSDGTQLDSVDRSYAFEGYLVYQLANADVSSDNLDDITKARLIAQCDVENGIGQIINFSRDPETDYIVPELMVDGADAGIQRSFSIKTDAFATGNNALINHKTYYFMVIAYGYNNYQPYDIGLERGQDEAFLASRKSSIGEIRTIAAIPHIPSPENGGTIQNSNYGDGVSLTRIEGKGNGLNDLVLTSESENLILANNNIAELTYAPGKGPVKVKVIDPLRVPQADFELRLKSTSFGEDDLDSMYWELENLNDGEIYGTFKTFGSTSEDVILDWGLSVDWGQYAFQDDGVTVNHYTQLITSSISYADPSKPWLAGISDGEGFSEQNWIRAGTVKTEGTDPQALSEALYDDYEQGTSAAGFPFTDASEKYEAVVGGTWAPYCLVSGTTLDPNDANIVVNNVAPTIDALKGDLDQLDSQERKSNIKGLNNVDIVLTNDKSLWTRCPVIEMQYSPELAEDNDNNNSVDAEKMKVRRAPSVDKNGKRAGQSGYNAAEGDLVSSIGMGWFPGYAIDLGTGERLNMAFGEDSWLVGENGRDMIWNPTSRLYNNNGQPLFGGQHWIYVFKNLRWEDYSPSSPSSSLSLSPRYDNGEFLYTQLSNPSLSASNWKKVFRGCTWVGSGLLNPDYNLLSVEEGLIPNPVRISIRVAKRYDDYAYDNPDLSSPAGSVNEWRNIYRFSTKDIAVTTQDANTLTNEVLDLINVVPNPYYAFSSYEENKLDNRIKITNLPDICTVTIYDLNGTQIRQFKKADKITSVDWDLKNERNIPIASGTYIIHVEVPGIGEKILKWFGIMRPVDLNNF
jgi:hypothetical protein